MKNIFYLSALSLFVLAGCKQDPPESDVEGTLATEFLLKFNGQPLQLQDEVVGDDGYRLKFETVKFYVSNPESHSENLVGEWGPFLVDFEKSDPQVWQVPVMPGTYSGISFGLGLDPTTNSTDPSSVEVNHPLSSLQNMYWTWASKYIFWKVEGRADTGSGDFDQLFLFHIGMDAFYERTEVLPSAFTITSEQTTEQQVSLDLHELFYAAGNPIDLKTESETQTMDNMPLAEKINSNFRIAFY